MLLNTLCVLEIDRIIMNGTTERMKWRLKQIVQQLIQSPHHD